MSLWKRDKKPHDVHEGLSREERAKLHQRYESMRNVQHGLPYISAYTASNGGRPMFVGASLGSTPISASLHPIDANELAAINAFLQDNDISAEQLWDALQILKKLNDEQKNV